ncbi:hypothetical protein AYX14_07043 [Cryptococcus neoformans]|nr:hypothetical protein AYX14_07043 [Cryptococcus neoformans var. grubii]
MELRFTNQMEEQTLRAACTVKVGNLEVVEVWDWFGLVRL